MDNLSSELQKLKIDKSKKPQQAKRGRGGAYIAILIIIALIVGAFAYVKRTPPATTVQIVRPHLQQASQAAVLVATGYIIAHHKIQVGSKIAGRVEWIGVEKGDKVKSSQVVVRLEDREYRAQHDQAKAAFDAAQARLQELERGSRPEEIQRAEAEAARARAELQTAESALKRIQSLVKEGVIAGQALDDASGRYESARASVASLTKSYELIRQGPRQEQIDNARSELNRARAAVDYSKTILDAAEIRVPVSGTILERNVEQGEMVTTSFVGDRGAKSFVVTLADLDDLQVELDINQNDFNRIASDQTCMVVTDAYPDKMYECRVDEISPEANRQKATIQVKVKILKPDADVRPDMNARVTFLERAAAAKAAEASQKQYLVVPKRAIVEGESGRTVYAVVDGKVQVKPITVEKENGNDAFVSAGLSGSESLIVGEPLRQLKPGDRVEIQK